MEHASLTLHALKRPDFSSRFKQKPKQKTSHQTYFAMLEKMQEGICLVNSHLQVEFWNQSLSDLFFIPRNASRGEHLFSLIPPFTENYLRPVLQSVFKNHSTGSDIIVMPHPSGKNWAVKYRVELVETTNPELAMISFVDWTPWFDRLQDRERRDYLRMLGVLGVGIAQEISSPLDAIYHEIGTLLQLPNHKGDEKHTVLLERVMRHIYQISGLTHHLIGLSQHTSPDFSGVDMVALLAELQVLWQQEHEGRAGFHVEVEPELPLVRGNAVLLLSALQNLARLIVGLTGEDGVAGVRAQVNEQDNQISLFIYDGGPGLSEIDIQILQTQYEHNENIGPGMGLNYFIARKVFELHKAHISVEKREKLGTTFRIDLPVFG